MYIISYKIEISINKSWTIQMHAEFHGIIHIFMQLSTAFNWMPQTFFKINAKIPHDFYTALILRDPYTSLTPHDFYTALLQHDLYTHPVLS